jgi:hypothetical protein
MPPTNSSNAEPLEHRIMGPVSIGFGLFLILVGLLGYFLPETQQPTALIPAGFGAALIVLGLLALKDSLRKHAMHFAAMVGLIGFLVPGFMVVRRLLNPDPSRGPAGLIAQAVMSVACLVFVGLCVKSFIDARRRRKNQTPS